MRSFFVITLISIFFYCCSNSGKEEAKAGKSKFSASFNKSVESLLGAYYDLSDAFVRWDSNAVNLKSEDLLNKSKSFSVDATKNDSTIAPDLKEFQNYFFSSIDSIHAKADLTDKRKAFSSASQTLFGFLNTIKYDQSRLFLNECTMPFNDTGRAVWISKSDTMRNPYLGLHHQRYGGGMIECGNNISKIDYLDK
ncbi:MAG: DUF3347 domain-containing protein [Flavisolibacter sp.]